MEGLKDLATRKIVALLSPVLEDEARRTALEYLKEGEHYLAVAVAVDCPMEADLKIDPLVSDQLLALIDTAFEGADRDNLMGSVRFITMAPASRAP